MIPRGTSLRVWRLVTRWSETPAETFGFINQADTERKDGGSSVEDVCGSKQCYGFVLLSILLLLSGIGEYAVHSYSVKE